MKAIKSITAAAIALGMFGALSSAAHADNIVTNQWYTASFEAVGSAITGPYLHGLAYDPASIDAPAAPFTITLGAPATLTVVDLEASGDWFEMYNNGGLLGDTTNTSGPSTYGDTSDGEDINYAFGDSNYSRGYFTLPAGADSITGILQPGSVTFGDLAFIVTPGTVPEPASLGVLGLGSLALFARRRRAARISHPHHLGSNTWQSNMMQARPELVEWPGLHHENKSGSRESRRFG